MKTTLIALFLLVTTAGFSQQVNPYPRTISTNGSAEIEIVPDEIYVQVVLKEYEKKPSGKVGIDKIRQEFLTAVRSLGLPDSAISVSSYGGYHPNPWWRKKNRKDELYASIAYQVKLRNTTQIDQLVDKLDDNATHNFYIQSVSHSRLEEIKKQLKIQAVKNAKEKAEYLAAAVGEQVGVAVTISEPNEFYQPYYGMANQRMMKAEMASADAPQAEPQADYKKIKIKYDVHTVFALK